MRRLLVNDALTQIPGTRTFWHDLQEWFNMEFVGEEYSQLAAIADSQASIIDDHHDGTTEFVSLIIRNATYFGPLEASKTVPTISLLQDIITEGPQREMQIKVAHHSNAVVFNSEFTRSKYTSEELKLEGHVPVIPLPVDFSLFQPGNPMGLQQTLALPDGCVCWIGSQHPVKGWDIFLSIARWNTDMRFVAVFKDALPEYLPPNIRAFARVTHEELVKIIGACRVGLCTSRVESQHLAGIEMGACGLPMVAPPIGTYFERKDMPGELVPEPTPENLSTVVRACLSQPWDPKTIRSYWKSEFDKPIIKAAWEKLIGEVEHGE